MNRTDTESYPAIDPASLQFLQDYRFNKRLWIGFTALAVGILIAGFWNFQLVDGFGRDFIAGKTIGDTGELAGSFAENGSGFGFIFAAIAGLAATFTACNCVAFAMIPGLTCTPGNESAGGSALKALTAFVLPVVLVGAVYGVFVGFLGPDGIEAINARPVRIAQAQTVFSTIGIVMIVWGAFELGFLEKLKQRFSPVTRQFFNSATTRATLLGTMVGFFAVGRPFPVFRQFLTYAATAENPLYGAAVMSIHGLGQIAILLVLFFLLVLVSGKRLVRWATEKPSQPRVVTSFSLLAGGAYFLFYWGLAFIFDIGRWGFKLGWY